jgi:hypothetical protein
LGDRYTIERFWRAAGVLERDPNASSLGVWDRHECEYVCVYGVSVGSGKHPKMLLILAPP